MQLKRHVGAETCVMAPTEDRYTSLGLRSWMNVGGGDVVVRAETGVLLGLEEDAG